MVLYIITMSFQNNFAPFCVILASKAYFFEKLPEVEINGDEGISSLAEGTVFIKFYCAVLAYYLICALFALHWNEVDTDGCCTDTALYQINQGLGFFLLF